MSKTSTSKGKTIKKPTRLQLLIQQRKKEKERKQKEEEEQKQKEEEELERIRLEKEVAEKQRLERLEKAKLKPKNPTLSKKEKARRKLMEQRKRRLLLNNQTTNLVVKEKNQSNSKNSSLEKQKLNINETLRSPICCVLGHVDAGKTKLLDSILDLNVQSKEAGGITQQIGAIYSPIHNIRKKTIELQGKFDIHYQLPGILFIDTPGHETFKNLRFRGGNLSDIAILMIDITRGLELQTIESIKILKKTGIPFVIALNKVDRLTEWKTHPGEFVKNSITKQSWDCVEHFKARVKDIKYKLLQYDITAELYYENEKLKKCISMIPISAINDIGISELLGLLVFLTQKLMNTQLTISDEFKCNVMDVYDEEGIGPNINVILSDGRLKVGEKIVVATMDGPLETTVKGILVINNNKKMKYKNVSSINASMGFKIVAGNLDRALAGTMVQKINVADMDEQLEKKRNQVMEKVENIMSKIKYQEKGIYVNSTTLGSLEGLITLLNKEDIPYSMSKVGKITKKDMVKIGLLRNHGSKFAVIMAFDTVIDKEITQLAAEMGITIIQDAIIYQLIQQYREHVETITKSMESTTIFPCELEILPQHIYKTASPLIVGVKLLAGQLKINTPLMTDNGIYLGKIKSIQKNSKEYKKDIRVGDEVCIKVDTVSSHKLGLQEGASEPKVYVLGRHYSEKNTLFSKITRESIDNLKLYFRDKMTMNDWNVVRKLKTKLSIK